MLTMKKRKQEVDKDINNACQQILIPKDTSYAVSTLYPFESSLNILQCFLPHSGTICILSCSPKSHPHFAQTYTELSHLLRNRKSTAKELGDNMLYSLLDHLFSFSGNYWNSGSIHYFLSKVDIMTSYPP